MTAVRRVLLSSQQTGYILECDEMSSAKYLTLSRFKRGYSRITVITERDTRKGYVVSARTDAYILFQPLTSRWN